MLAGFQIVGFAKQPAQCGLDAEERQSIARNPLRVDFLRLSLMIESRLLSPLVAHAEELYLLAARAAQAFKERVVETERSPRISRDLIGEMNQPLGGIRRETEE